jgi:hypothetical protein
VPVLDAYERAMCLLIASVGWLSITGVLVSPSAFGRQCLIRRVSATATGQPRLSRATPTIRWRRATLTQATRSDRRAGRDQLPPIIDANMSRHPASA